MAMIPRPRPPGEHPWPPEPHHPRGQPRTHAATLAKGPFHLRGVAPSSLGPTLLDAFRDAWESGQPVRAEDFRGRLDPADPSAMIELVYQEFCLAEEYGQAPDPRGYLDRFPEHHDRLARLFGLHDAIAIGPAHLDLFQAPADLPGPGDAIGPYQLLRELGRGSFARVFLAEQTDLEDRLVVLKVATRPSPEPMLLARAAHPHIVAVLRHGEADDGALHLTCMPFQGGATLGAVLETLRAGRPRPRSGTDLLDALDRAGAPEAQMASRESSERDLLAGMSYSRALAWMIARLARALDHAQQRGVSHGDLKPSNILIAADAKPLLLDFNLAADWQHDPAASSGGDPGGTLAYMAPERLRALAADTRAPFPNAQARHRADLYALGLILAEALGAAAPSAPLATGRSLREKASALATRREDPAASLRNILRKLPVGLRPIVARCLAPDPADRYPRAVELAEDLDSYRMNLPPRHAPRVGWIEQIQARAIRARRVALYAAIAAVVVAPLLLTARRTWNGQQQARASALYNAFLDQPGVEPIRGRRFGSETRIENLEPTSAYIGRLEQFGVPDSSSWLDRNDLRWLPDAERVDLQLAMAEQAWCLAHRVSQDSTLRRDAPRAWAGNARIALAALSNVGAGAMPAPLTTLAAELAHALNVAPSEPATPAPAWLEDYLSGLERLFVKPREAVAALDRCLLAQPSSFQARYARAAAHSFLGETTQALRDLDACVHLRPRNAYLRIIKAGHLILRRDPGDIEEAARQLDVAEAISGPTPGIAHNYRLVRLALHQLQPAYEDSVHLAVLKNDGEARPAGGHTPLARLIRHRGEIDVEEDGRVSDLIAALDDQAQALGFQGYCLYELGRFQESLRAFDDAVRLAPDDLRLEHSRVMVIRKLGGETMALLAALIDRHDFPKFVADHPHTVRAYRFLAADQCAAHDYDAALQTIADGITALDAIDRENQGAPETQRYHAELHYAAARCAMIRGLADESDSQFVRDQLRQAHAEAPELVNGWFAQDRLFDPIRKRSEPPAAQEAGPGKRPGFAP